MNTPTTPELTIQRLQMQCRQELLNVIQSRNLTPEQLRATLGPLYDALPRATTSLSSLRNYIVLLSLLGCTVTMSMEGPAA